MAFTTIHHIPWCDRKGATLVRHPQHIYGKARRGMALVMVILLLTVTSLILGTMVQELVRGHHQFSLDVRAAQTRWQAEAALKWAQARRELGPQYAGEDWLASSSPLPLVDPSPQTGQTRIRLASRENKTTISVVVLNRLTNGPEIRIRRELIWNPSHSSLSALEAENSQP